MNRVTHFGSPLMLGFEEIERMAEKIARSNGDGYPPYNIERITRDDTAMLRITLAVAGFSEDELDISLENNQLTVSGRQEADPSREFLHRGIAARQFQKSFVLANGIEVRGAELVNGLLSIDLVRLEPEHNVKRIKIAKVK